ncbi:MAG: hypothetical protein R3A52_01375 [Polyangiales bacterium]
MLVDATRARLIDVARVAEATPQAEAAAPTLPPPPAASPPSRGPGAGPWVLVGAGAVGLGLMGAGLGLFAHSLSQAEDACPGNACVRSQADRAQPHLDDAETWRTAAIVSGAVGAAAVIGGFVWWARAPRRAPAVTVSASVGPHGSTVGLSGSF